MGEELVSDRELTWCSAAELSEAELACAARWIRSMDSDYYEIFSQDPSQLDEVISRLQMSAESEFGPTQFVRQAGKLAGFVTYFLASEIFPRRIFVLKALLAASADLPAAKRKLQAFNGPKFVVAGDALYLSKIFVCPPARRTGLSAVLFNRFVGHGVLGQRVALHVRRDNVAALYLYEKNGFIRSGEQDGSAYFLMEKILQEGLAS